MINLVDTKEASKVLGISHNTLKKYRIIGGGPPYHKFGRTVRYNLEDVMIWASKRKHSNTASYR